MMPSIPEARRGRVPWGLLGMIVLVLSSEGYLTRHGLEFTRPEGTEWRLSGRAARRAVLRETIFCFGSSMSKQGVNPRVVGRSLGKPSG